MMARWQVHQWWYTWIAVNRTPFLAPWIVGKALRRLFFSLFTCMLVALPLHAFEPAPASSSTAAACVQAGSAHASDPPPKTSAAPPSKNASAAAAAKPGAKPASIVPLQANGLIERSLRQISQWAAGLGVQLKEAWASLLALLVLFERSGGHIANEADRDGSADRFQP